jgi:uncharacterized protein YndB with AHSA1/START domain
LPRLERNILIRASADQVWRVMVDPERSPDWEAGLVAVEGASNSLDRPGATCTQVMSFRRRTIHGELEVTEANAPRERLSRVQPPLTMTAERRERLVETDKGTVVTIGLAYQTRGGPIGGLLNLTITRPRLAMMLAESARNLKRCVEAEAL